MIYLQIIDTIVDTMIAKSAKFSFAFFVIIFPLQNYFPAYYRKFSLRGRRTIARLLSSAFIHYVRRSDKRPAIFEATPLEILASVEDRSRVW